ncbi:MAG TPA: amidohydrolase family protein, partial [Pseudomonadales bacterium]|nr:amidohydrolase family protein [Pseudomonadales bacterium]
MKVLVEAGMTPMEAIMAGTRVGAELLRWDDKLGTLKAGMLADIIAVPGNPLENMSLLEQVIFVMKDGEVAKR